MSELDVTCPNCSKSFRVSEEMDSDLVDCPACKRIMDVGSDLRAQQRKANPAIQSPLGNYEYSVVPFVARVGHDQGSAVAAEQLEKLIHEYAMSGWEYVRMESVVTNIAAQNGCFGLGATRPKWTSYSMVVFRR